MNNDLISRSALLEALPKEDVLISSLVRKCVVDAPGVDAEVVRRGSWLKKLSDCFWPGDIICSECKSEYSFCRKPNYCPNCGAKMRNE